MVVKISFVLLAQPSAWKLSGKWKSAKSWLGANIFRNNTIWIQDWAVTEIDDEYAEKLTHGLNGCAGKKWGLGPK
jgi:hypothetical protein